MSDPYADSEDEGLRDRVASQASEAEEAAREGAAEGLHRGAATVRERAEDMGGRAGEAGVRVADTMERTAGYLREHDTAAIWNDLERMIREHPKQAVAGAVVAGLIIGRLMR